MAARREPQPRRIAITRHIDRHGRQVPAGTPGAKKVRSLSETYFVKYRGRRWPLETTDLQTAWSRFRALQKRLRDEELGIATPEQDHAAKPLAGHLDDFLGHLRAKGTSAKQIETYRTRLTNLAALAGWRRITDISRERALHALARLVSEQGRSQRTRNHYTTHLKAFAAWLVDAERLTRDPVRKLAKVKVTEHRHKRRTPTDDEVRLLMTATDTPAARSRRGMTGPQRALGYRICMATGFRANELRALSRECFDLDGATVTLPARREKRRRGARQPLPGWLVAELRAWFAAGGECWSAFPENFPGRLLKADLKAAGVAVKVAGPECDLFVDFGSLRKWYISRLVEQPGIDPKTLMDLARHSTADLTLKLYAEARDDRQRAAVDNIGKPGEQLPKPGKEALPKPPRRRK